MGLTYEGKKDGKYLLRENNPGELLVFRGQDANRFEQVDPPRGPLVTKVNFELTVAFLKSSGFIPRESIFDRLLLSVVGPHAGEDEASIFKRKMADLKKSCQTFWLCHSHNARPEFTQMFCDGRDGEVPVLFLAPASRRGARPTTESSVMREYSAEKKLWTPLPKEISPVTGKASSTAYALVLSELHLGNKDAEIDLSECIDAVEDKPVKFRLGASTVIAKRSAEKRPPNMRRIVAVGHLAAPYAVWVR